ncbi:MAG: Fic family protein [Eggerthellaceae bacterium]|nr:Fic family protein [Eggerthellaceae bacterium]
MTNTVASKRRITKRANGIQNQRGGCYNPHPIAHRAFSLSGETLACEAKTEIALIRLDEKTRSYPYAKALIASVLRVEAMATVRTDGIKPDLMQMLLLEAAEKGGRAAPHMKKDFLRKWFPASPVEINEASYEAYCAFQALHCVLDYTPLDEGISADHLMNLYQICMRGSRREKNAQLRRDDKGKSEKAVGVAGVTYITPDASRIDDLMDDLMDFCNRDYLAPLTRSAIAHFQLEAIRPVAEGIDRLGRLLAFLLWKQAGLIEVIFPPFSITPSVQTQKHTELLVPYKTKRGFERHSAMEALDDWIAHCSRATRRSTELTYEFMEAISSLEKKWRSKLAGLHRNSALDLLLRELPGTPILTVTDVVSLTGKKFQTANECVNRLVEEGILVPFSDGKRNRLFKAPEAIEVLQRTGHRFFPQDAPKRENFFTVLEVTETL